MVRTKNSFRIHSTSRIMSQSNHSKFFFFNMHSSANFFDTIFDRHFRIFIFCGHASDEHCLVFEVLEDDVFRRV